MFPEARRKVNLGSHGDPESTRAIKVGYLGTGLEDGPHELHDGKLRLMKADGSCEDFAYDQYLKIKVTK